MARTNRKVEIETGHWWALVRGPKELPVLFATREQARENQESDERMVRVTVTAKARKGS